MTTTESALRQNAMIVLAMISGAMSKHIFSTEVFNMAATYATYGEGHFVLKSQSGHAVTVYVRREMPFRGEAYTYHSEINYAAIGAVRPSTAIDYANTIVAATAKGGQLSGAFERLDAMFPQESTRREIQNEILAIFKEPRG